MTSRGIQQKVKYTTNTRKTAIYINLLVPLACCLSAASTDTSPSILIRPTHPAQTTCYFLCFFVWPPLLLTLAVDTRTQIMWLGKTTFVTSCNYHSHTIQRCTVKVTVTVCSFPHVHRISGLSIQRLERIELFLK